METQNKSYLLITEEEITPIIEKALQRALAGQNQFQSNKEVLMEDMVSQEEAMKLLGRKNTWFYNMRMTGQLHGTKSANKWWYNKSDLQNFIRNGQRS